MQLEADENRSQDHALPEHRSELELHTQPRTLMQAYDEYLL